MAFDNNPDLNKVFVRPLHLDELIAMYDAGETKTVLEAVKTDLVARINAGHAAEPPITAFTARTITDGRCAGLGWYPKSNDTLDSGDDEVKRLCSSCGAFGRVEATNVVQRIWQTTEEPPTEL